MCPSNHPMPFRETVSSWVAGKCCQSADPISEGFELGWSAASAISDTPDNEGSTAFHSVPYFVRGPIIMSHRRRGLKPDLHFLTVLRLQVQGQGVSGAGSSRGPSLQFANPAVSSGGLSSGTSLVFVPLLTRTSVQWGHGPS